MPSPTFNAHSVDFVFTSASGLEITPGAGILPSTLSLDTLICVIPTDVPNAYTLVHQIGTELIRTPITHPPQPLLDRFLLRSLPAHLTAEITILISTTSGGGFALPFYTDILTPLCETLHLTPHVVRTTSATSIATTVSSLSCRKTPQTLLLLAGDTGVFDVVNAVNSISTPLSLAVFPLGTGNALASSYHAVNEVAPLHALLFGTPQPMPLFTATFSKGARWKGSGEEVESVTGAVVVSWGFHAALVADADVLRGENVGVERFKVAAAQNLEVPLHRYCGEVVYRTRAMAEGEWRTVGSGEHFYVLATLCSNLEDTFKISPGSRRGDNAMRLVQFGPMESGEEVMGIMMAAYQGGKHVEDERVLYEEAMGVKITMGESEERWRRVCVDGGTVVLPEGGWVEVARSERTNTNLIWIE